MNMYVVSRNPDYVEEPLVFKPERWSRDGSAPKLNPFISVPFGFGPRSCYGGYSNKLIMYRRNLLENGTMEVLVFLPIIFVVIYIRSEAG